MASTHELLVVHAQDRVVAVQEVGVEHNLDAVLRVVEELHTTDLVEDRVVRVVRHVVRRHWRQGVPLEREDAPLQQDLVLLRQKVIRCRQSRMLATKLSIQQEETEKLGLPV